MSWLKKYYGDDFEKLSPNIIAEGKGFAIVRITKQVPRGHSGVGFVLVNKFGRHNVSETVSLHEGMPGERDMKRMKDALKKAEEQ